MSEFGSMCALSGWKAIAQFFSVSESKVMKRKDEWYKLGVIFYTLEGRPPQKRVRAFPWKLMAWQSELNKKNEFL